MVLRPVLWLGLAYITGEALGFAAADAAALLLLTALMGAGIFVLLTGSLPMIKTYKSDVWLLVLPVFLFFGYLNVTAALNRIGQCDEILKNLNQTAYPYQMRGIIGSCEEKENSFYIFVKDVWIYEDNESGKKTAARWYTPGLRQLLVVVPKNSPEKQVWLPGASVKFTGIPEPFTHPRNEGMFDERQYFHSQGVEGRVWADFVEQTAPSRSVFQHLAHRLRSWMIASCHECLSEPAAGVAISMVTGSRTWLDKDIKQLYQKSGIAHILAISGLHISFLGRGFYSVLRRIGVPIKVCMVLAIGLSAGYGWFTGMAVSAQRAVMMTGMSVAAKSLGYTSDRKIAISLSAMVILIFSPLQLIQPGFLLSFLAVTCLAFSDDLWQRRQKWLLMTGKKTNRLQEAAGKILVPSAAVTLGMLPVVARCFYEIPLYSMFLNLIVIPVMSFLYPAMFSVALLGSILGLPGLLLGDVVEWLLYLYEKLCIWTLALPGSVVICGKPSLFLIAVIYIFSFLGLWILPGCRLWPWLRRTCLIFGCMIPLLVFLPHRPENLSVTMIDVGQGDCFLISLSTGENILVDGGSSDIKNSGTFRLIPLLKARGIDTLDAVFLSHMDQDHISAVAELLENEQKYGGAGQVGISKLIFSAADNGDAAQEKIQRLTAMAGERCYWLSQGDFIKLSDLNIWAVGGFDAETAAESNDCSQVLWMEYKGVRLLFTGDISTAVEPQLIDYLKVLDAQYDITKGGPVCHLLKAAHHGSEGSSSQAFLEYVQPQLVLLSCGIDNRYNHPHPELIKRLRNAAADYYVSAQTGEVICQLVMEKNGKRKRFAIRKKL